MAVTQDATISVVVGSATGSQTRSITIAGTDRLLVVTALSNNGANPITGITYNGVALTKKANVRPTGATFDTDTWTLVNPSTGANDLVITASGSSVIVSCGISYNGVDQTTPVPTVAQTTGSSATMSHSITTTVADSWIYAGSRTGGAQPDATGTNYVRVASNASNGVHAGHTGSGIATPASTSVSVGIASSQAWGFMLLEIAPVGTITQALTASITAAASIAKSTTFARTLTASITAAATVSKGLSEALTASITAAASISTLALQAIALTASATVSSTISTITTFKRTLTGSTSAATTISRTASLFRTLTGSVAVSSTISATKTFFQTLTAAVSAAGSVVNGGAIRTVVMTAIVKATGKLNELFYKKKYTKEDEDYKRKY